LLDFLGTWVAGGLGLGGLGLGGLCDLDLIVGLGPSPPSVHIALYLLCFLVPFSSSRQSISFVSNSAGWLDEMDDIRSVDAGGHHEEKFVRDSEKGRLLSVRHVAMVTLVCAENVVTWIEPPWVLVARWVFSTLDCRGAS
jgi:hypothetical protein